MKLKPLYCLAEEHFVLRDLAFKLEETSKGPRDEGFGRFKEAILKTKEEREREIRRAVEKYKPRVFFVEGVHNPSFKREITRAGYEGEVIFLDEGFKDYACYRRKREEISKPYEQIKRVLWECMKERVNELVSARRAGQKALEKEIEREIKELDRKWSEVDEKMEEEINAFAEKTRIHLKRERKWAETIAQNYEEPSMLICGLGHVVKSFPRDFSPRVYLNILEGMGIVRSLITLLGVAIYSDRVTDSGYLGQELEKRGIRLKVVGFLKGDEHLFSTR